MADVSKGVQDNCGIKIYFSCTENEDVKFLQSLSKDTVMTLGGMSIKGLGATTSIREVIVPALQRNEILETTFTRFHAFFIRDDGSGYHAPTRIVIQPPTTKEEYDRLNATPLPKLNFVTDANGKPASKDWKNAPVTPEREAWLEAMRNVIEEKRRSERGEV